MKKNKTTQTTISVTDFINEVKDATKRKDSFSLIELIKQQTELEPKFGDQVLLVLEATITNMTVDTKVIVPLSDFHQERLQSLCIYPDTLKNERSYLKNLVNTRLIKVAFI